MLIRKATKNDLEGASKVHVDTWKEAYKGIGKALVADFEQWLKGKDYKSYGAWVLADNKSSVGFYKSLEGQFSGSKLLKIGSRDFKTDLYVVNIKC